MHQSIRSTLYRLLVLATVMLLSGCSSGLIKVKGRITRGDAGWTSRPNEAVAIEFCTLEQVAGMPKDTYSAQINPDGTFLVAGRGRGRFQKGIAPGRYRIAVQIIKPNKKDVLKGAFTSTHSPIIRDIDGRSEVVIDLEKPEG